MGILPLRTTWLKQNYKIMFMKEMKPVQVKQVMIEIILGKRPSMLKIKYPEHYQKIRDEIVDYLSAGRMVKLPVD